MTMTNNLDETYSSRGQRIEELLKNNEEPTDDTIQGIRKILADPLEEVGALESEIKQAEHHLQELKQKRKQVQGTIAPYNSVLSPIRRLPADILHNIFYHCLPTNRNSLLSAAEAPLLLTRICHSWRVMALSSPRLWAQIHITFSDEDLSPELESPYTVPRMTSKEVSEVTNALRLRCQAVEEWLSRSGTCPLSISVHYISIAWPYNLNTNFDSLKSDITSRLFSILTRFANRWQNMQFEVPFKIFKLINSLISASDLDMLLTLNANFFSGGRLPSHIMAHGPVQLALGRNLKHLSILSLSRFCDLLNIPSNWKNITSLSCHSSHSITETCNILRSCPKLVHFMITVTNNSLFDELPPSREIIPLLSLRAIHVLDYLNANYSEIMFSNIHAPQLEWVDYKLAAVVAGDEDPPIMPLIRQCVALKKLTIFAYAFTTQEMRKILRNAPSITHLVLGVERRAGDGSLLRSEGNPSHLTMDFGELFGDSLQRLGDLESEPTLLPRLQTLEISNGMPIYLTEESLLAFITERLSSSNGAAALKHVGVTFNHAKGKDIEGPVLRRAQLEGLDIKLSLDYLEKVPHERYTHPAFDITSDQKTWIHHDNGDYQKMMPSD